MNDVQMTKDEWVEVFRAAGMDDDGMQRWHREFESRYPDKHRAFLSWLQLSDEMITKIQQGSRS
jgi:hypothetical protein